MPRCSNRNRFLTTPPAIGGRHELGQNWLIDRRFAAQIAAILRHAPTLSRMCRSRLRRRFFGEPSRGHTGTPRFCCCSGRSPGNGPGIGGTTMFTASWWPWFEFSLATRVPAAAFAPVPTVDGGLLVIRRRETPLVPAKERPAYQVLIRVAFTGPGRGLPSALAAGYSHGLSGAGCRIRACTRARCRVSSIASSGYRYMSCSYSASPRARQPLRDRARRCGAARAPRSRRSSSALWPSRGPAARSRGRGVVRPLWHS